MMRGAHLRHTLVCLAAGLFATVAARGQLSLQSTVDLALKNSPRVRGAQADRDKAVAAWQQSRDAYIPVVATQGGYGQSTGAPLGVPVVFSISAQSLGFSFAQPDTIRAAKAAITSADYALERERTVVVQDTTNTYLSLDNALQRQAALRQEVELTGRLVTITQERIDAGVDARVELPKAERTRTQVRLAELQVQSEIAGYRQHLATAIGVPYAAFVTVSSSVPAFAEPVQEEQNVAVAQDAGLLALQATATSKQYLAFADQRYLFRPQIAFSAYYSRVYTGSSAYLSYYPCFDGTSADRTSQCYSRQGAHPNSQNALGIGFQINLPLLDMAHRAKARESAADARRAVADVDTQRGVLRESRARLKNSALELQLRADLAREEQEIAQDQLETVQLQLSSASGNGNGVLLSPRDALQAEIQVSQRRLDLLLANLQLQQTQLNLLETQGGLPVWVQGGSTAAPSVIAPAANAPVAPGSAPGSVAPSALPVPQPAPVQPAGVPR